MVVASSGWHDWGGEGPVLHLAHANGFPPEAYRTLIRMLTPRVRVVSVAARPLWDSSDPAVLDDWSQLADDLADTLQDRDLTAVIGVGHSLGAVVTAWAAAAHPGLFSRLVLIDPVLFAGARAVFWRGMKRLRLEGRLPLVQATRRRRERFPDAETARAQWARRSVFSGFDPRCFDDYVNAALTPHPDGGVTLRYPKTWEARIFELSPADPWPRLADLDVPVTVLAGSTSDTFLPAAARKLRRKLPQARVEVVPGASHFVPFERPEEVARRALDGVDAVG